MGMDSIPEKKAALAAACNKSRFVLCPFRIDSRQQFDYSAFSLGLQTEQGSIESSCAAFSDREIILFLS